MILKTYIGKTIILSTLTVLLALAGLELFIEFMHEFSDIGSGNYGWIQAMYYVPLLLPQDLYLLFPMAGLLGGLIGLSILTSHGELTVMQAMGMSLKNIIFTVMKTALILLFVMAIIGEVLAPITQHRARVYKSSAVSSGEALLTKQGLWLHNKNNFLHINDVSSEGNLHDVLRYVVIGQDLVSASFAKEGKYVDGKWIFTDIAATQFEKNSITSKTYKTDHWDLDINPRFLGLTNIDTEQKSLWELRKYIKYQLKNGLNAERNRYIFWQRIFSPLACLVMIFLSVPFVFVNLRNKMIGLRIIFGTLCGFTFYLINQFVGPLVMFYHISPILAALFPSILFSVLGIALL